MPVPKEHWHFLIVPWKAFLSYSSLSALLQVQKSISSAIYFIQYQCLLLLSSTLTGIRCSNTYVSVSPSQALRLRQLHTGAVSSCRIKHSAYIHCPPNGSPFVLLTIKFYRQLLKVAMRSMIIPSQNCLLKKLSHANRRWKGWFMLHLWWCFWIYII